jgi:hypothetical protein
VNAIRGPGSTSRRAFVIFGVAAGLGLAGCSLDNRPGARGVGTSPAATPTSSPTPTPLPGTTAAASRESDLAAFAAAALDRFDGHLSANDRNLLTRLRDAHLAHAAVLTQQDPTAIGPTTGPSPTPAASATGVLHSPKAVLAKLHALESRAAKSYSALATTPNGPDDQLGPLALLWGSLATASTCYADACVAGRNIGRDVVGDQRANVALPDRDTAIQNLLEQCYAIIFGYQNALAHLSEENVERAQASLAGYRDLRDRLADQLSDQQVAASGPHAAYQLPVQPTSQATAAKLIASMENRVLPFVGQWLATAADDERSAALSTMISIARDALTWSPKIIVWPGYPAA